MKPQSVSTSAIAAVVVIGAVGYGLYLLVVAFGSLVGDLGTATDRIAALASVTVLISCMILSRALSRRARGEALVRETESKESLFLRLLTALSESRTEVSEPIRSELDELHCLLALGARKSVVDHYVKLRSLGLAFDPTQAETRAGLVRLLAEMRKDLGHRDVTLLSAGVVDLLFSEKPAPGDLGSREFRIMHES